MQIPLNEPKREKKQNVPDEPDAFPDQAASSGQVMLLGRGLRALDAFGNLGFSAAELARVTSLLSAVSAMNDKAKAASARKPGDNTGRPVSDYSDLSGVAKAVRMVYGLPWPLKTKQKDEAT